MKSPDGRFFWVSEDRVQEAYQSGLTHESEDVKVPITTITGKEEEARAGDLPNVFARGGSYRGFSQAIEDTQQEIEPTDYMTPLERIGTAATALDPLMLNRIVGGGINRALDGALGLDPNTTNETLREAQASQPWIQAGVGIASQLPLGRAAGRGISSLGAAAGQVGGAGARYGAMGAAGGLEGVGYSAAMYVGEAVMGNPEANAEKFIENLGSSFLWGALPTVGVEAIGDGIRSARRAKQITSGTTVVEGTLPDVRFRAIDLESTGNTPFRNLQILDNNDNVVGNVKLAVRNPEASYTAARNGVSVEEFTINPEMMGKRVEQATLGKLVDEFGAVHTPSTGTQLPDNVQSAFESLGVAHTAENGMDFITAHRKPIEKVTTADRLIQKYGEAMQKRVNRLEDPELASLWKRLTNKEAKSFRGKVIQYHNNEAKGILDTVDNIQRVDDAAVEVRRASESLKERILSQFDTAQTHKLKNAVNGALEYTEKQIGGLTQIAGEFDQPTIATFKRMSQTLRGINSLDDPIEMMRQLRNQSQKLGGHISRLEKVDAVSPNNVNKLRQLRKAIDDDIIRNVDVTGDVAENFNRIQKLQHRMLVAEKDFNQAFKVKGRISERKVRSAINTKDKATAAVRQNQEEIYLKSVNNYLDEASEMMQKYNIDLEPLRNKSAFKSTFLGEMREVKQASRLVNNMIDKSTTFGTMDAVTQGFFSHIGAVATSAMGLGWYPGAIAGQQLGGVGRRFFNNPVNMINQIEGVSAALSNTNPRRLVDKIIRDFPESTKRVFEGQKALTRRIGGFFNINEALTEDYPKMYDEIERKINQIDAEELKENLFELEEIAPQHTDALVKKALEVMDYIKENKPPKPRRYKDVREDIKKMDALVQAAFNPSRIIEDFAEYGETRGLKYVRDLHPYLYNELQQYLLSEVNTEEEKSKVLTKLDKLTEVKKIRESSLLFQNIYATIKGEGGEDQVGGQGKRLPASATNNYGEDYQVETDRFSQ